MAPVVRAEAINPDSNKDEPSLTYVYSFNDIWKLKMIYIYIYIWLKHRNEKETDKNMSTTKRNGSLNPSRKSITRVNTLKSLYKKKKG